MNLEKVDMHVHTNISDGCSSPEVILKEAKNKGTHLAITDHNQIEGVKQIVDNKLGVVVIPGIEVTCKEGPHLLFYFESYDKLEGFFKEYVVPYRQRSWMFNINLGAKELMEGSKKFSGLVVAAHPFGPGLTGFYNVFGKDQKIIKLLDGVEGINSNCTKKMNNKAVKWGKRIGKIITAGTDSHTTLTLGKSYMTFNSKTVKNILREIKIRVTYDGKEMNIKERFLDLIPKLKMWLGHPIYFVKKAYYTITCLIQ